MGIIKKTVAATLLGVVFSKLFPKQGKKVIKNIKDAAFISIVEIKKIVENCK